MRNSGSAQTNHRTMQPEARARHNSYYVKRRAFIQTSVSRREMNHGIRQADERRRISYERPESEDFAMFLRVQMCRNHSVAGD